MTIAVNQQAVTPKQKENKQSNLKKSVMAMGLGTAASLATLPVSIAAVKGMGHFSKNLTKDELSIVNNTTQKIVDNVTNLGKKGVVIHDYRNFDKNATFLEKLFNPFESVGRGKNAFYTSSDMLTQAGFGKNSILVNKEKLPFATFHELGHAFNFNNSKFWKGMQKLRTPGMLIASAIGIYTALTNNEKSKEGSELKTSQKVKNTIRDNSHLIAFGAMVPILMEEGMASIRGCKWASQLMNKNLAKKVLKTNVVAFTSYLATALGFSLFAMSAKKVKDAPNKN